MFDISEFDFENDRPDFDREELSELAAELGIMPLQKITAIEEDGVVAVLECQHKQLLLPAFREEENMRCLQCYNRQMRKAQKMIERAWC